MPVEYSPVTEIAPMMPASSIVNWIGMTTAWIGSNPGASIAWAMRTAMPIVSTAAIAMDHHVDRRVMSLIASPRTARAKVRRRPESTAGGATAGVVTAGAAVMRAPSCGTRRRLR